jgi:multisubunit Na+/H+ antiporter MnhG subunit
MAGKIAVLFLIGIIIVGVFLYVVPSLSDFIKVLIVALLIGLGAFLVVYIVYEAFRYENKDKAKRKHKRD